MKAAKREKIQFARTSAPNFAFCPQWTSPFYPFILLLAPFGHLFTPFGPFLTTNPQDKVEKEIPLTGWRSCHRFVCPHFLKRRSRPQIGFLLSFSPPSNPNAPTLLNLWPSHLLFDLNVLWGSSTLNLLFPFKFIQKYFLTHSFWVKFSHSFEFFSKLGFIFGPSIPPKLLFPSSCQHQNSSKFISDWPSFGGFSSGPIPGQSHQRPPSVPPPPFFLLPNPLLWLWLAAPSSSGGQR